MDYWSYILDTLNFKYNLAIIVSNGNYYLENSNKILNKNYIDFILNDNDANLIPPSLAVSSLSIGSKAKYDVPYNSKKSLRYVPIAKKEHISPFTRSGFGYAKSIKPETIAYGGNFSFNTLTKRINDKDRNLGIFSTSIFNSNKSWFETRPGTSFAAPYITHLVGTIKKSIPDATGNLLRALLINTSYFYSKAANAIKEFYKDNSFQDKEMRETITKLVGYGEIREQYLINSYDHYVTMYYDGKIGIDKVNVFEIPIPDEIYYSKKKNYIHISLAYNPPCRDSRIDYAGVKMSFDLYRGLSLDDIKKYTCKPDDEEFEKDKLPKEKQRYKCPLIPSSQDISRGTLLKTTHKIAITPNARKDYGYTFYLVVRCAKRWYEDNEYKQPYALVVSIECEDENIKLYRKVEERIRKRIPLKARAGK